MPRKKRRSAWASISQVDSTTWRIRYWAEGADGYRRRSRTGRGTRKQAEAVRAQLLLEHGEDAPSPTVAQAWERWALPAYERRVEDGDMAEKSLQQYRSAYRAHVEPRWGSVPLDEVRPLQVQQWIDGMGRSQATSAVKLLSAIMDYGVRYELVDHNPMRERYLMPSASTVSRHDDGIWTVPQLADLLRSMRGDWREPAVILAGFAGMRVGESMGPLAGEVTLHDLGGVKVATVPVVRQIPNRGMEPVSRLKTGQSERVAVVVGPPAVRLAEIASSIPADWPLTNDGAGRWQAQARLSRTWDGAHPFRNLRNSYETWMRYDLRAPRWLIQRLMGHKGETVGDLYYDRPDGSMLAEMMADLYRERPIWDDLGLLEVK